MSTEAESYRDRWYSFHESIVILEPGNDPVVKGPWPDTDTVLSMIDQIKSHHPAAQLFVVSSRCGGITMEPADQYTETVRIGRECAAEHAAYIKAGVCADCGACNAKEAEEKCRPRPLADTGDYTCAGDCLWEEEDQ